MHATVHSSTINLVKTIIGAGLLAIPYSFKNDGVLVGVLLTLVAAITSCYGLFILAKCSKTLTDPRHSSFFSLCMLTYPALSPLFDFAMIIQCFGVGLSYLILMGDIFPSVLGGDRTAWIVASAFIVVPLCSLKKLDHLKYSSMVGLFALSYLSLMVVVMFIRIVILDRGNGINDPNNIIIRGPISWWKVYSWKGLLSTFSIIIFAFTGSMNLFTIINELKDNSMSNIVKIINGSILISCLAFLTVGVAGYITFGSNTMGNILLNYDQTSIWVTIGNLSLALMLLLSFPLLFHPLRIACNNLFVWCETKYETGNSSNSNTATTTTTATTTNTPITLTATDDEYTDENTRLLPQPHSPSPDNTSDNNNISNEELEESPLPGDSEQHTPFPMTRFYLITAFLLISMYLIALRINSFAFVLALVGATGSTSISFTLPGLFGYKLIGTNSLNMGQLMTKNETLHKRLSLALAWFGISVMILSLYITIMYDTD